MEKQNKKILWTCIQQKGDSLMNKLPNHPYHPNGRNPYAHVCSLIKDKYGESYKEIDNIMFLDVKKFIEEI